MAMFNSFLYVYQRVKPQPQVIWWNRAAAPLVESGSESDLQCSFLVTS
jgi:hypothetical protein